MWLKSISFWSEGVMTLMDLVNEFRCWVEEAEIVPGKGMVQQQGLWD